jgi:2-dehydro-3-deoxygalactonokinase
MWLLVDWGTSNVRLWTVDKDQVCLQHESQNGVGQLRRRESQLNFLRDLVSALPETPDTIFAIGMAGSTLGPFQTTFSATPTSLTDLLNTAQTFDLGLANNTSLPVLVTNGLKGTETPPDVMRGEELQSLAIGVSNGYVLCPGTHSKLVKIQQSRIVDFSTYMTGELFQVLKQAPALSNFFHEDSSEDSSYWFEKGLELRDLPFASALFNIRRWGLNLPSFGGASHLLSGLLIGHELVDMRQKLAGTPIHLLADGTLAERYSIALGHIGMPYSCYSVTSAIAELTRQIDKWMESNDKISN